MSSVRDRKVGRTLIGFKIAKICPVIISTWVGSSAKSAIEIAGSSIIFGHMQNIDVSNLNFIMKAGEKKEGR